MVPRTEPEEELQQCKDQCSILWTTSCSLCVVLTCLELLCVRCSQIQEVCLEFLQRWRQLQLHKLLCVSRPTVSSTSFVQIRHVAPSLSLVFALSRLQLPGVTSHFVYEIVHLMGQDWSDNLFSDLMKEDMLHL